ncbi:trehalose-phosphatase [Chloroflexota bacterium]
MEYLFDHLSEVEKLLKSRPFGLVTDVDGTISRIAPTPDEAVVSSMCRRYLEALVDKLDLIAVISGRSLREVMGMVGVEGLVYVGNHGLDIWNKSIPEMWSGSEQYVDTIAMALSAIKGMASIEGLYIENKGPTASIHYRNSPDTEAARDVILAAAKSLTKEYNLKVTEGRMVVELRPNIDVNKGSALESLIHKYSLSTVLFLGDDLTDVDAFESLHNSGVNGFAIVVGSEEAVPQLYSKADFVIHGVGEVERFLAWLVDATAD